MAARKQVSEKAARLRENAARRAEMKVGHVSSAQEALGRLRVQLNEETDEDVRRVLAGYVHIKELQLAHEAHVNRLYERLSKGEAVP
jgi:ABC-type molybdate transport system substrate-binding protein